MATITILVLAVLLSLSSSSCTFTISNNCPHPIWPGTLAGAGTPQLATTGFRLDSGESVGVPAPTGWSGRIWARTGCVFDGEGAGTCETGDCGGRMECGGMGALPPATLFEITLGKGKDQDYYDVSLVDGYNLPLVAAPRLARAGAGAGCNATGCLADLNIGCPKELQVEVGGEVIACRSACEAFGLDEYCCSGEYANPTTCKPSFYSTIFKAACPRAYSYAFDDGTSTFTCKASDYNLVFCPTATNGCVSAPSMSPSSAETWIRRSNGFSGSQPSHKDDGDEDKPKAMVSSGNTRSFHFYLLLLFLFFF